MSKAESFIVTLRVANADEDEYSYEFHTAAPMVPSTGDVVVIDVNEPERAEGKTIATDFRRFLVGAREFEYYDGPAYIDSRVGEPIQAQRAGCGVTLIVSTVES